MKRLRTYNSANAWLSAEMVDNYSWIHQFSAPEIAELELAAIKVLDDEIINLSCEDFELPTLDPILQSIRGDVVDGHGFALLRGLPVQKWSLELTARTAPSEEHVKSKQYKVKTDASSINRRYASYSYVKKYTRYLYSMYTRCK